jgi:curli production assembly/transport component CsgF
MLNFSVKAARSGFHIRILAMCAGAAMTLACGLAPGQAGSLVYTPYNPSFGGNPNNGPVLKNLADAQNLPLASQNAAQAAANAAKGTSGGLTQGQLFAQQLQSQLLGSLANKITQAIFGTNATFPQSFTFSGTTITATLDPKNSSLIDITIVDGSGTQTDIQVPKGP